MTYLCHNATKKRFCIYYFKGCGATIVLISNYTRVGVYYLGSLRPSTLLDSQYNDSIKSFCVG